MNKPVKSILYWSPRILGILFSLFLVVFSFDVFGTGAGFWATAAGFLIHNIPTFFLLLVLWLTWRREWIGGVVFIMLGIAYILATIGRMPLVAYFAISGPLFLIGILFLLNWFTKVDPDAPKGDEVQPEQPEEQEIQHQEGE